MVNISPPTPPPASFNLDWLTGYRKLIITLACLILSTVLLLYKIITGDQWVELNKFVIPAFLAANLAERWINGQQASND